MEPPPTLNGKLRPANGNYIDGHWDLWCFSCEREIPTLPGHTRLFIPGPPAAAKP